MHPHPRQRKGKNKRTEQTYLSVPKVCAYIVGLLAKLQRHDLMHFYSTEAEEQLVSLQVSLIDGR